jgi:hypothetical protein
MDDALRKVHIRNCVRDALSRHGVDHDNPIRAELEANATIAAGDSSRVIMRNGNSLDVEIENLLSSQCMAENSSTNSRSVAKNDADGVRNHFADIANGTVRVESDLP